MEGTVKFYNFKKRFGFITGEDGKDYFFHQTGIESQGFVKDGMKATFEVANDEKGPKAVKVNIMQ
ncbi:MAG: cold shock domain-containing protein [Candidatus Cloacimonetes bacterium]|jgi:CspA family cold shock protein|nr:cold shock domain-containing protein [Candidatus Cloacimonadota bacterium]